MLIDWTILYIDTLHRMSIAHLQCELCHKNSVQMHSNTSDTSDKFNSKLFTKQKLVAYNLQSSSLY